MLNSEAPSIVSDPSGSTTTAPAEESTFWTKYGRPILFPSATLAMAGSAIRMTSDHEQPVSASHAHSEPKPVQLAVPPQIHQEPVQFPVA